MKTIFLAAAALLTMGSANAAIIDPVGFARDYCILRRAGETKNYAMDQAVSRNLDVTRPEITLSNGTDLDVALGTEGVRLLCPDLL